jgi:hypothetical protein
MLSLSNEEAGEVKRRMLEFCFRVLDGRADEKEHNLFLHVMKILAYGFRTASEVEVDYEIAKRAADHAYNPVPESPEKRIDEAGAKTRTSSGSAKKQNGYHQSKDFLIGATTPHDELFQLERTGALEGSRGGIYSICRVDENGSLHLYDDPTFKKCFKKTEAIAEFRRWATERGYDIIGDSG